MQKTETNKQQTTIRQIGRYIEGSLFIFDLIAFHTEKTYLTNLSFQKIHKYINIKALGH